ncbi:MAG: OmpA family protein [Flavobacteriales bacterium]
MKSILLTSIISLFFGILANGQVATELEKGDKAFDDMLYDEALYFYEVANEQQPNDPDITRRIAALYRRIGIQISSTEWYKKTIDLGSTEPEDILYYAEGLKSLSQYDEAIKWYSIYNQKKPNDTRAISHIRDKEYFLELFADSSKYEIKKLKINNSDPVIGLTQLTRDKYLISAINIDQLTDDDDKLSFSSYLDIFEVTVDDEFELNNPKALSANINGKYHDGPVFYSPWDQTIYITRNNIKKNKAVIDKKGSVNTKIYSSKFNNGDWSAVEELSFNNDAFSNAHACVSSDGQAMFFSSNRDGGFGGMDLYVSRKVGDVWGEPSNLGPNVNTEGNEMFPFLSSIGTLYFASDGHAGLGGLDIFFSEEYNGTYLSPLNMGAPINGNSDDFSLLYDDAADRGYFCSNRAGRGNDDIFFFQFKTLQQMLLAGNIFTENKSVSLEGENVQMKNLDSNEISEVKLNAEGEFQFIVKPGENVEISLVDHPLVVSEKPLFAYNVPKVIVDPYLNIGTKEVKLIKPIEHTGPLSLYKQPEQKPDIAEVPKKDVKAKPEVKNDIKKQPETTVKENEKEPVTDEKKPLEKKPESAYDNATSIIDLNASSIQNIIFDFSKSFIPEDQKNTLDQIATLLKEDPTTMILVKTFCDARGSKTFNENLSMSRAMSVQGYLMKKGIAKNRIKTEWFGEEQPVNGCIDGVPCTKEEHEVNRRAEFKIVRQ